MRETSIIESVQNPRTKRLRAIARFDERLFLLEGKKHVFDALHLQAVGGDPAVRVRELYIADGAFEALMLAGLGDAARRAGVQDMSRMSQRAFESVSRVPSHQGVLAVCQRRQVAISEIFDALGAVDSPAAARANAHMPIDGSVVAKPTVLSAMAGGPRFCVLLDRAHDPVNVGAVVRNCASFGAAGVILSKESANAYSPKAVRASAGGALISKICQGQDALRCVQQANERGIATIAADAGGEDFVHILKNWKLSAARGEQVWQRGIMFIFGSEGSGIDKAVMREAGLCASIAMRDGVDSLNLAVTSGIFIFALRNFLL